MLKRKQEHVDMNEKTSKPAHGGNNGGDGLETRVARLESDVSYIKRDIQEIKTDIREIRQDHTNQFRWLIGIFIVFGLALGGIYYKIDQSTLNLSNQINSLNLKYTSLADKTSKSHS